ncbi:MAG TPA: hypothetical protein DCX14_03090 [Flavobacteriales bacterium]|nr:hypothetical protein [Flavobacteriales bacterium]
MKNLFLTAFGVVLLASCTTDSTCRCTYDATEFLPAYDVTTECIGCDKDETEAFEQACVDADAALQEVGADLNAQCVLN